MKRRIAAWLAVWMVCLAVVPAVAAAETESGQGFGFFISVYHAKEKSYIVENTQLKSDRPVTILETLDLLVEQEYLTDYACEGLQLDSVSWEKDEKQYTLAISGGTTYYVKRNGDILSGGQLSSTVVQGDIIEWIYTDQEIIHESSSGSSKNQTQETAAPVTGQLTQEAMAAVQSACDWLSSHQEESTFYPVVMGNAGKSVDVALVNRLLAEVSKTESYSNITNLAKPVLLLSFCGFDATNMEMSGLLSELMEFEGVMRNGVFGAINTLNAYDCRDYTVPNGVLNNRAKLVEQILAMQNADGGFPIFTDSESDIDTTAMALTALSGYLEQEEVDRAVQRALNYLSENQTAAGEFGYEGEQNCESLAQVIIALSSCGVDLADARFQKGDAGLVELLLRYQKEDGGFSHLPEGESSVMPTEQAIIALAAVRKGKNPYFVASSVKNTTVISEQAQLKDVHTGTSLYVYIGAGMVALLLVTIIVGLGLKRTKREKK